jgi:cell division protein FtsZ
VRRAPQRNPEGQPAQPAARAPAEAERPRFGINTLINRMTGHPAEGGAAPSAPASRTAPAPRRQPPVVSPAQDDEMSAEQERIEIPAFLRRQAN